MTYSQFARANFGINEVSCGTIRETPPAYSLRAATIRNSRLVIHQRRKQKPPRADALGGSAAENQPRKPTNKISLNTDQLSLGRALASTICAPEAGRLPGSAGARCASLTQGPDRANSHP